MITDEVADNLAKMLKVSVDNLPAELLAQVEDVEHLIRAVRPDGGLRSTQVMAMLVYNYKLAKELN